jgi:ribosome-binding protein aMBF1 (putative translation factor)
MKCELCGSEGPKKDGGSLAERTNKLQIFEPAGVIVCTRCVTRYGTVITARLAVLEKKVAEVLKKMAEVKGEKK